MLHVSGVQSAKELRLLARLESAEKRSDAMPEISKAAVSAARKAAAATILSPPLCDLDLNWHKPTDAETAFERPQEANQDKSASPPFG